MTKLFGRDARNNVHTAQGNLSRRDRLAAAKEAADKDALARVNARRLAAEQRAADPNKAPEPVLLPVDPAVAALAQIQHDERQGKADGEKALEVLNTEGKEEVKAKPKRKRTRKPKAPAKPKAEVKPEPTFDADIPVAGEEKEAPAADETPEAAEEPAGDLDLGI